MSQAASLGMYIFKRGLHSPSLTLLFLNDYFPPIFHLLFPPVQRLRSSFDACIVLEFAGYGSGDNRRR